MFSKCLHSEKLAAISQCRLIYSRHIFDPSDGVRMIEHQQGALPLDSTTLWRCSASGIYTMMRQHARMPSCSQAEGWVSAALDGSLPRGMQCMNRPCSGCIVMRHTSLSSTLAGPPICIPSTQARFATGPSLHADVASHHPAMSSFHRGLHCSLHVLAA